jgi:uncharacterized protein YcbK (DUF882 family)
MALVQGLEELRRIVKKPLVIKSGFRCNVHNARVGGVDGSVHTLGIAADVETPAGVTDEQFAKMAERVRVFRDGGIGIYDGRIHVDTRGEKARWDVRTRR